LSAIAFLLLAIWILTFKFFDRRTRFEFYALDFCWGALILTLISAWILGNVGGEAGISERLLLSSKTAQALMLLSGFIFGLGVLALLGSIRILGTGLALLVAVSVAGIPAAGLAITGSGFVRPAIALALMLVALLTGFRAARGQDGPPPAPPSNRRPPPLPVFRQSTKGLALAGLAGIFFGIAGPLALFGTGSDFGLGAYAGLLVFTIGIPVAVIPFSFFLLHVTVDLPPTSLASYWRRRSGAGKTVRHRWGLFGGLLWAGGALAYLFYRLSPPPENDGHATLVAVAAPVFAALAALLFLKEGSKTRARASLWIGFVAFAAGVLLTAA
jgi:hypothetical protein